MLYNYLHTRHLSTENQEVLLVLSPEDWVLKRGRGAFSIEKAPRECPRPTKATKDISCRCYLSVLTELES